MQSLILNSYLACLRNDRSVLVNAAAVAVNTVLVPLALVAWACGRR